MGRNDNSGNFLQVVANNFDVLALPLVTLVYPLIHLSVIEVSLAITYGFMIIVGFFARYASIRAIETKSRTDDQQWLTYWVLYSLMTIFELTFAKILECFPVWTYAKLIFTCWLVLPQFNGAAYVYRRFIRPYYMNPQVAHQMWYFPRKKGGSLFSKPDDVLTAAEKYMEEHGTEAFERLISKADRERSNRKSNNYMIFDDDYMY